MMEYFSSYSLSQAEAETSLVNRQSSLEIVNIKQVLAKIDSQNFPRYVSQMAYEVSSRDEIKRTKAHELMKLAIRWAFLLDFYYETDRPIYLEEAEKQLCELYQLIPQEHCNDLISVERKTRKYFDFEKHLRSRIQANDSFTGGNIIRYLYGKSGDALFYGRLLRAVTPMWSLTNELRIQIILGDIGKDITDYENDIKQGLPNVLYLFFSGKVEKSSIPQDMKGAVGLANSMGVADRVLTLAARVKEKALASKDLGRSPTLRETIVEHYGRIERLLGSQLG
jgi:hypothetical protein